MTQNKKRRNQAKYPGLTKNVNSRVKQEYMDQDYINQLDDEAKTYLSNFNEEFYGGNFKHPGKKLHRSDKNRKACYNRNNARNRCIYGRKKAGGLVLDPSPNHDFVELDLYTPVNENVHENYLINLIDVSNGNIPVELVIGPRNIMYLNLPDIYKESISVQIVDGTNENIVEELYKMQNTK